MSKSNKYTKMGELLMGIIGDEETVTGFLLAGIGERGKSGSKNFFIISNQEQSEIESIFNDLVKRRDIGIVLISQHVAEIIRTRLDKYDEIVPAVLEIPSKNVPYDITKDSIMQKAMVQLYGQKM